MEVRAFADAEAVAWAAAQLSARQHGRHSPRGSNSIDELHQGKKRP